MPIQSATATGADLATVLTSALADLIDHDDVMVQAKLPHGVDLADVRIELGAAVTWSDEDDDDDDHETVAVASDEDDADDPGAPGAAPADVAASASDDEGGDDANEGGDVDGELPSDEELDELDEEADAGADFVEGLLDAMDLPGELRIRVLEDSRRAEIEVVDMDSGALIGRRGSTLEAIQELMRCALQSQFERRVHVHVDVEGYRSRRLEKLLDKADEAIDHVLDSGEAERLEPMDVFERKAIHEFVSSVEGVLSRSQGREPSRRVVIELAD